MISYIILSLLIIWLIVWLYQTVALVEPFTGNTPALLEGPAPAPTSVEFRSPKSNIMNFNETTELHQEDNEVKAFNSHMVDPYIPLPDWVYPFTYVNRKFDQILLTLVHKIEKDSNHNKRLHDRLNEWRKPYPYQTHSWNTLDLRVKQLITTVIDEINRRFNMEIPIVGFRQEDIKVHWVNEKDVFVIIKVYKRYTIDDIKYPIEIDPNINEHLKSNFERELLIGGALLPRDPLAPLALDSLDAHARPPLAPLALDSLDAHARPPLALDVRAPMDRGAFKGEGEGEREREKEGGMGEPGFPQIKYLRFPALDYENEDIWDDMTYVKELDNMFYIAKSKDPMYRMLSNTEARDGYITYLGKVREKANYRCFPPRLKANHVVSQIKDQTLCEQANALWEKRCEKDTDCPYQKSRLGGCNQETGFCHMPVNVKPLTFRKPANPQNAFCYNCQHGYIGKGSVGQCCSEQEPNPDYVWGEPRSPITQ